LVEKWGVPVENGGRLEVRSPLATEVFMETPALTPEQQEEADRIYEILRRNSEKDLRGLAQLLAAKADSQLFGATEFELRDRASEIAAMALETALSERKKRATEVPASTAPDAATTPSSNAGKRKRG
jgi:hypothetical protein